MATTPSPVTSISEAATPKPKAEPKAQAKTNKPAPKPKRPAAAAVGKPNKFLPTDRITFSRQLDVLRGWAAASGPTSKSVSNDDVAEIVKMAASTLSMNNAFYAQNGLLQKADGGYIPAPDVFSFLRAYEWSPESAATKLAPTLAKTWFAGELLPKLAFGPLTTDDAIQHLADACNAGPDYRNQLRFLLDYLGNAGLVEWDGNQVRKGAAAVSTTTSAPSTDIAQTPANPPPQAQEPSKRAAPSFFGTTEGAVNFNVSVRVDMSEFANWQPERIAAFFAGMAQVLAAKADVDKGKQ